MQLKFKNSYLIPTVNLLQKLPLKGKLSIARSRLVQPLEARLKELGQVQQELASGYAVLDQDGNPKLSGNEFVIKTENKSAFARAQAEFMNETAIINLETYEEHGNDLRKILQETDLELTGVDSEMYLHLCELFRVFDNPLDEPVSLVHEVPEPERGQTDGNPSLNA